MSIAKIPNGFLGRSESDLAISGRAGKLFLLNVLGESFSVKRAGEPLLVKCAGKLFLVKGAGELFLMKLMQQILQVSSRAAAI